MPGTRHAVQGPRGTTHGEALPRVPLANVTLQTTTLPLLPPPPSPPGTHDTPALHRLLQELEAHQAQVVARPEGPKYRQKTLRLRLATYLRCSLGSLRDLFVSVSDRLVRGRHCGCFPWCRRDVHTRPISNQLMAAVHAATSPLIGWPPGSCSDVTLTSHIFLFFYLQIFTIQIIYQKPSKYIRNQMQQYFHYKYLPFGVKIRGGRASGLGRFGAETHLLPVLCGSPGRDRLVLRLDSLCNPE